ncbi:MAG: tRNA lysidine(34) synthetase TilS [Gomphosphaeria aponina SAG 52.96 = DSM 107014]|uniref:tRNA(Ile)-lysidine synthase n=1 Tax=Gomphosphaeria aponina SAG 52.96 = DSM 107014 TaxID=1521640 RepID=A0A941GV74_9CHRO|nr:tRNA lysidine(34) synthetase TilS [Gomphosphaeria aponina SAG 52.96 = DSM 107014]
MSWSQLHGRLHQTLRDKQLLQRGEGVLVAVSGGQDSLCLTKLLLDLQPKWEWKIAIAHCDHGWSSDEGIADHVEKIAKEWGINYAQKTAEKIKETEAAARKWRYEALREIAETEGLENIVTGHTLSDRAETVLYNLIRGAGADGIATLTWERQLTEKIRLVRPILNISRRETGEFCQAYKLPIWEDAANKNMRYARNRIRQDLIPYLKEQFNPQVEKALAQTGEILREEVEYLENCAQEILAISITENKKGLNRGILKKKPLALGRRVVKKFLEIHGKKAPKFEEIETVMQLMKAPNKSRTSSLSGGWHLEVEGEWIVFRDLKKK